MEYPEKIFIKMLHKKIIHKKIIHKKIILAGINAKYIHSNPAIYSLRACLGELKEHVQLKEYTINNHEAHILQDIFLSRPAVLCFSCYIWNIRLVLSIAREFAKLCPGVPIWLGGPEVSFETEEFLKEHTYITGVMIGEGEDTFRELCEYYILNGSEDPDIDDNYGASENNIEGIAFRDGDGNIVSTAQRPLKPLDDIPFIYEDINLFKNRIVYYESSRGCPFSCSYCLSSIDRTLRFRSLEIVKKELLFFLENGIPQVKFIDRTFNCSHERTVEIWKFIREHDNGITNFHFEISADILTDEEIELLGTMRPGLVQLEIGVQTVNKRTLKEIRRVMDISRLKVAVTSIAGAGNIHRHLDLIAGLPYEDYDSFRYSFDDIFALRPDDLQLGFLKVLKGSHMHEAASGYGMIYHDTAPYEVMATHWLSYDDMIKIKAVEEMLEVYYNSGQYGMTMDIISLTAGSMFDFFLGLGQFYRDMGYDDMNHSRIRRCEILMEYLESGNLTWIKPEMYAEKADAMVDILPDTFPDMDIIREALVFDLYHRENCKSRPGWAINASDAPMLKEMNRRYCKNGKLSHAEPFHYDFLHNELWNSGVLPWRNDEPAWLIFYYDRRNPLNNQAEVEEI